MSADVDLLQVVDRGQFNEFDPTVDSNEILLATPSRCQFASHRKIQPAHGAAALPSMEGVCLRKRHAH